MAIDTPPKSLSVEEYLAVEEAATQRHEYHSGQSFAMAGGTRVHNTLTLNVAVGLRQRLETGPCQVYMADVKLRIESVSDSAFYYPDVMVVCRPDDSNKLFVSQSSVVMEVLSPETERIDRREKRLAYQQVPSLEEYVLIAQDCREVTVFRRARDWSGEVLVSDGAVLELESLGVSLPLAEIYRGV